MSEDEIKPTQLISQLKCVKISFAVRAGWVPYSDRWNQNLAEKSGIMPASVSAFSVKILTVRELVQELKFPGLTLVAQ